MSEIFWSAACVVLLLAGAFFSGTEMGLYCVNRLRARLQAERRPGLGNRALWWMLRHPQETVIGILLGNNFVHYLLTVSATILAVDVLHLGPTKANFYMAAILSPLVFVFGDVVPKNWFQRDADRLMNQAAPLLGACLMFLRYTGVLWVFRQLTRFVLWLAGHGTLKDLDSPRAEVVGLLREGGAHGAITAEQAQIIERVINLSQISVGSIMVPQRRVVSVSVDADRTTLDHIIESSRFSRLPVVGRNRRSIVGVVDIHDILADEGGHPIEGYMQPALTIPASESAAAALVQLQKAEATLAIVTDSRHGVVGIVTLKDVVEEIFGELPEW